MTPQDGQASTFQFNLREDHIVQVFIARDDDDQDILLRIVS